MDWGEQRYSPMTQINPANVAKLALAWSYELGPGGGNQQATPLYSNGVLHTVTNWSIVTQWVKAIIFGCRTRANAKKVTSLSTFLSRQNSSEQSRRRTASK
jgi:hypothetical protein